MVPRNPTCKFSTQEKAHGGHPPRGKMVDGRHGGKDNGDGRAGGENKDNQHSYSNPLGPRSNLPIKRYLTGKQRFVFRFAFGGKIAADRRWRSGSSR